MSISANCEISIPMIQFECREEIFWKLKIFECNKGHAHTLATITHINRTQCKHQTLWRLSSEAMFTHVFRYPYIPQQIRSDPLQGPARWVEILRLHLTLLPFYAIISYFDLGMFISTNTTIVTYTQTERLIHTL